MTWVLASAALLAVIGLVQAVVWLGQPESGAGRRLLAVFVAPLAALLLAGAVSAIRVEGLL